MCVGDPVGHFETVVARTKHTRLLKFNFCLFFKFLTFFGLTVLRGEGISEENGMSRCGFYCFQVDHR